MAVDLKSINPDCMYTTKEAASLLCKSQAWFERHRWAGTGPVYSPGRPVRYLGADLVEWMKAQRVQREAGRSAA